MRARSGLYRACPGSVRPRAHNLDRTASPHNVQECSAGEGRLLRKARRLDIRRGRLPGMPLGRQPRNQHTDPADKAPWGLQRPPDGAIALASRAECRSKQLAWHRQTASGLFLLRTCREDRRDSLVVRLSTSRQRVIVPPVGIDGATPSRDAGDPEQFAARDPIVPTPAGWPVIPPDAARR